MEIIIVTGLSGAGKSQAVNCLEDQGYYCIDNMPLEMMKNFIDLSVANGGVVEKAAFVVDIRGAEFKPDVRKALEDVRALGIRTRVIFLEASNEVLIRRFSETRRRHPVTGNFPTVDDIENEREQLKDIRSAADFIIDTSNMKTAKLKSELIEVLSDEDKEETFVINIMSFGFKNGIAKDADFVFTMTDAQRDELRTRHPDLFVESLALFAGGDIADPYGGTQADYDATADTFEGILGKVHDFMLLHSSQK